MRTRLYMYQSSDVLKVVTFYLTHILNNLFFLQSAVNIMPLYTFFLKFQNTKVISTRHLIGKIEILIASSLPSKAKDTCQIHWIEHFRPPKKNQNMNYDGKNSHNSYFIMPSVRFCETLNYYVQLKTMVNPSALLIIDYLHLNYQLKAKTSNNVHILYW